MADTHAIVTQRARGFRAFLALRLFWIGLIGAAVLLLSGGLPPTPLLALAGGAVVVQALLWLLWWFRRLPRWHDMLSALLALALLSLASWYLPDHFPLFLAFGIVPLVDVARWRGWEALILLFLFPLPMFILFYLQDTLERSDLALLLAEFLTALLGMALAAARTTRESVPIVPIIKDSSADGEVLARVAAQLAQETRMEGVLEVLVRDGSRLLEEGSRKGRVLAMALTFKAGFAEVLQVRALHNLDRTFEGKEFANQGTLGELLKEGEPLEARGDQPPFDTVKAMKEHTLLLFPLRTALDLYGAVIFATKDRDRAEQETVQRTLIALADQAGLALHSAMLRRHLTEDRSNSLGEAEDARHQLARDLHDGPVQRVAAIAMQLDYVKSLLQRQPEQALPEVEQLQALARQASQEMRTMLFALRPIVLESEGLAAALETLIERLRQQDKLDIRLDAERLPRLEERVEEVAFAIVQEAIGNAKKYASDAPIRVRLACGQGMVVAQVQDQGPGFDLQEISTSYGTRASLGLLNMRERAQMVEGILEIDTAPGKGTTVSLAVPIAER